MATAKKKTKRITTANGRSHTKAAQATASVAKSAASQQADYARQGASFARGNANEWQRGANEWAKQSAKLYQLPFAGSDVSEATQHAAETMKSATENMMRAGSDMMNQMFGGSDPMAQWNGMFSRAREQMQMPNAQDSVENARHLARESAEQMTRSAQSTQRAASECMSLARENSEAMIECCNTAIAVSKEIGAEMINFTNRTFAQNVELGKQLLSCRTLDDMFDLSSKFMKTNLDALFSESVLLSEKLFQCATDISEPMNERFSDSSDRLSKAIAS